MNMRKEESEKFISELHGLLNSCSFDGRAARIHLTQENSTQIRITLYYCEKPVVKKISFNSSFSLKTLGKLILKEYPCTFKHIKKRKEISGCPSISIY